MKWHGISEVAKLVNRSRQAVYKKIKRLTLEEKLALGENLMEDGQILLSDEGIKTIFMVSPTDDQVDKVDSEVVEKMDKVDSQVDTEVVTVLKNQLVDREREVVRLDNLLTNILTQLGEERHQRGEDRIRTDTILMKLTNDISTMQKALEFKKPESNGVTMEKYYRNSSGFQGRRADPRQGFTTPVVKSVPIQREVTAWESIKTSFDDVLGFAFGRG